MSLAPWVPIFKGVDHAVGTNTPGGGFPDLQVAHAIRVDLHDPDVRLLTSPMMSNYVAGVRETRGYTVSQFLLTNKVQLAINGGLFDPGEYYLPAGTPMDINGLSICQGTVVSRQNSAANASTILFASNNVPTVVHTNWPPGSTEGVYTAVPGTYPLVIHGVNVGFRYRNDPDFIHQQNPRTAFGISEDKRYLYLLTIDGRQPGYSEGAYDSETGAWLLLLGAYEGINMDGGGSTTLVIEDSTGKAVRLNRSSAVADSGRERTVGSHFGLFAKPVPAFINDVVAVPDDRTAVVRWTTLAPASSQVLYGLDADTTESTAEQSTPATAHTVTLTGLTPATTYYYKPVSVAEGSQYTGPLMVFTTTNYVTAGDLFDLSHPWTYTTANLDGVNWTDSGYDDSAWESSGPGLLWVDVRATGPNPDVQPKTTEMPANPDNNGFPFVTYYFRTHFAFTNRTAGATLVFSNYIDDGAVFHLNGAEIHRLRMDPAPAEIANETLAAGYSCEGDATCPDVFTVTGDPLGSLVTGDNVLAVEVHNYNPRSPDITYGLSLGFTVPQAIPPVITLTAGEGTVRLEWNRPGFLLQEAVSPSGPWRDIPESVGGVSYTVPTSGEARYFRLVK